VPHDVIGSTRIPVLLDERGRWGCCAACARRPLAGFSDFLFLIPEDVGTADPRLFDRTARNERPTASGDIAPTEAYFPALSKAAITVTVHFTWTTLVCLMPPSCASKSALSP
jgi:hypothetical protein